MKKIIASAGLIAVGTASLQGAPYAPGITQQEASKPWSVAASLRGFYDDNYASTYSANKKGSGGMEFRPSAAYNLQMDQTLISLSYEYALKYYFDRAGDDTDQQHQFNAKVDHAFSDRYRLKFEESFVYAQEPELLDTTTRTAYRSNAEGVRNNLGLDFTAGITEVISTTVGYYNGYYDYKDTGSGSYSALLDRWQNRFHVDGMYQVRENTSVGIGYAYWITDYSSHDYLAIPNPANPAQVFRGDDRDNNSHLLYAIASHAFSPKVKLDARVGAQYVDFSNPEIQDSWSPFIDLTSYFYYLPGSWVQLGLNAMRTATDFAGNATAADYISDQEVASLVASINHRITPQLMGSLIAQYQYGRFEGAGSYDGMVDNLFTMGANLEYKFNPFWSAELGYSFDRLDSDIPSRSFSRNRIYGGVRAQY